MLQSKSHKHCHQTIFEHGILYIYDYLINVWEHSTRVCLPQPEQLDLKITDSSLTTKNVTCHTCVLSYCAAMTPLCSSLLGHTKVVSRCPNKYLILITDTKWYYCHSCICKFRYFYTFKYLLMQKKIKALSTSFYSSLLSGQLAKAMYFRPKRVLRFKNKASTRTNPSSTG